jgi:CRISPR system Cascade subunit CasE
MSAALHMVKFAPDSRRLALWAQTHRLVGPAGELGYAVHAALAAAFGEHAPKPFRLVESGTGSQVRATALYGYTRADGPTLVDHARAFAEPDVVAALGLDGLAVKAMPARWEEGRRLGFEVRLRPTVRRDRNGDRDSACERDAFQVAFDRAEVTARSSDADLIAPTRDQVYVAWFRDSLARGGGARLVEDSVRLVSFQRLRVARRGRPASDGRRRLHESEGPDAVLQGVLEVADGEAFAALLRRGVGRHRAFGFGMLLLRPPRSGVAPC